MSKFEKGKSGNPSGRPKGAISRGRREIRNLFSNILYGELDKIAESLDYLRDMHPDKYLNTVIRLTELLYPNGLNEENEEKENITIIWGEIAKSE